MNRIDEIDTSFNKWNNIAQSFKSGQVSSNNCGNTCHQYVPSC